MTDLSYYAEGEETRGPLSIGELVPLLARIADPRRVMIWRQNKDKAHTPVVRAALAMTWCKANNSVGSQAPYLLELPELL
jgi:hypothetical protein